jgi:hypothetical protein
LLLALLLVSVAGVVAALAGVAALDGVDALAGAEAAEELVVLLELPQPANTTSPTARARIETMGIERIERIERFFAAAAAWSLISLIVRSSPLVLSADWGSRSSGHLQR